ncbi:hypothetical protein FHT98_0612 [Bosea sp. AK1]|uniref:hypothetical protein n=1 Tax=Bosea sp. AK1 TaxID=2587160 RepID=UPI0011525EE7|nr:hypothetical protein [Bosea sp. AK1]TQI72892.1 hypothetical protein FHT98_0612 [Bosea sp. AK1]
MAFGVTPAGFARKRLPEILAELEEAMRLVFGPGVIQTPESPLGQLNGLFADLSATHWEIDEEVYNALDPDQAEGVNLDRIAKLRLLTRAPGESDIDFRNAITNAGRARIDMSDLTQALSAIDGVTWVQTYVNDGDAADADGISAHSVAVAIIGGDDDEIAKTVRAYVVPGIGTYGNTILETTIEGFCRSIKIVRPTIVNVTIEVEVQAQADRNGCPPPSALAIAAGLDEALTGATPPRNGEDLTEFLIRQAVESRYPNVQVVDVKASRSPAAVAPVPIAFNFFEIMAISADRITIIPV